MYIILYCILYDLLYNLTRGANSLISPRSARLYPSRRFRWQKPNTECTSKWVFVQIDAPVRCIPSVAFRLPIFDLGAP